MAKVDFVEMAGYWPHSFFFVFIDFDSFLIYKHAKKIFANIQPS